MTIGSVGSILGNIPWLTILNMVLGELLVKKALFSFHKSQVVTEINIDEVLKEYIYILQIC